MKLKWRIARGTSEINAVNNGKFGVIVGDPIMGNLTAIMPSARGYPVQVLLRTTSNRYLLVANDGSIPHRQMLSPIQRQVESMSSTASPTSPPLAQIKSLHSSAIPWGLQ